MRIQPLERRGEATRMPSEITCFPYAGEFVFQHKYASPRGPNYSRESPSANQPQTPHSHFSSVSPSVYVFCSKKAIVPSGPLGLFFSPLRAHTPKLMLQSPQAPSPPSPLSFPLFLSHQPTTIQNRNEYSKGTFCFNQVWGNKPTCRFPS